jgi:hypothetical protein
MGHFGNRVAAGENIGQLISELKPGLVGSAPGTLGPGVLGIGKEDEFGREPLLPVLNFQLNPGHPLTKLRSSQRWRSLATRSKRLSERFLAQTSTRSI